MMAAGRAGASSAHRGGPSGVSSGRGAAAVSGGSKGGDAFSRSFGKAADVEAMRASKSAHDNEAQKEVDAKLEKTLNVLEKKDLAHEKAQQLTSVDITVFNCMQCKYNAESALQSCRDQGHTIKKFPGKKRWFVCGGCKHRTSEINKRFPMSACPKCGEVKWKDAAATREKAAATPAQEFQPRGEEHGRFLNSMY